MEYKSLCIFICAPKFEWLGTFAMLRGYYIYFFLLIYLIPLFKICSLYVLVGRALWRWNVPGVISTETEKRSKQTRLKLIAAKTALITAAFALCCLPVQLPSHFCISDIHYATPPHVMLFCYWSGHTNSEVNPWLYIMLNDKFGKRSVWYSLEPIVEQITTRTEGYLVSRLLATPLEKRTFENSNHDTNQ